jgi:antitoxin YefM
MTRPVTYTDFRQNLAKYMDKVRRRPIYVEHKKRRAVVISEEEYKGLTETIHLLSNPANAKDLLKAITEADAGKFKEHKLIAK